MMSLFFKEKLMIQLIKKGGLRERANRSKTYQGSENTEKELKNKGYAQTKKNDLKITELPHTTTK